MPIQPINAIQQPSQTRKFKLNPVSSTGYGALAAGTLSVIAASGKKNKTHKFLGYLAGALAFVHTGIILGARFASQKFSAKSAQNKIS